MLGTGCAWLRAARRPPYRIGITLKQLQLHAGKGHIERCTSKSLVSNRPRHDITIVIVTVIIEGRQDVAKNSMPAIVKRGQSNSTATGRDAEPSAVVFTSVPVLAPSAKVSRRFPRYAIISLGIPVSAPILSKLSSLSLAGLFIFRRSVWTSCNSFSPAFVARCVYPCPG